MADRPQLAHFAVHAPRCLPTEENRVRTGKRELCTAIQLSTFRSTLSHADELLLLLLLLLCSRKRYHCCVLRVSNMLAILGVESALGKKQLNLCVASKAHVVNDAHGFVHPPKCIPSSFTTPDLNLLPAHPTLLLIIVQLKNRHRLSVLSKMFRWWSTVIGANEQRNYQLKMLEERVKRRQVQITALLL